MIMKTSAHVQILCDVQVCLTCAALLALSVAVFKQKHDGKTLKVKISVRRTELRVIDSLGDCSAATLTSTELYHQDGRWTAEGADG